MKNKILILIFALLSLFIWKCADESPLVPETPVEEEVLNKTIGEVTPILSLAPGNSTEGIAIDLRGNMYVSNTRGENRSINEILKFTNNGNWEVYATLPGAGQVRGLVADLFGNIYAAFADNPEMKGVYRIGHSRIPVRLKGSEEIGSPNSLTFDWKGNLYATDSYKGLELEGAVWCYNARDRKFNILIKDKLLNGALDPAFGKIPGANGIAFYPPNKLYIANTSQGLICQVTIGKNRNHPIIELVKQDPLLTTIDGIAVDIYENIYGVLPGCTLGFGLPPVVKLDTRSGIVTPIVLDNSLFDTPTSLAFGRGWGNWTSIYIANANLPYGQPPQAGPGVVKVSVGIFGLGKNAE